MVPHANTPVRIATPTAKRLISRVEAELLLPYGPPEPPADAVGVLELAAEDVDGLVGDPDELLLSTPPWTEDGALEVGAEEAALT